MFGAHEERGQREPAPIFRHKDIITTLFHTDQDLLRSRLVALLSLDLGGSVNTISKKLFVGWIMGDSTEHFRYRLGIDVGVASLGLAILKLDEAKDPETNEYVYQIHGGSGWGIWG